MVWSYCFGLNNKAANIGPYHPNELQKWTIFSVASAIVQNNQTRAVQYCEQDGLWYVERCTELPCWCNFHCFDDQNFESQASFRVPTAKPTQISSIVSTLNRTNFRPSVVGTAQAAAINESRFLWTGVNCLYWMVVGPHMKNRDGLVWLVCHGNFLRALFSGDYLMLAKGVCVGINAVSFGSEVVLTTPSLCDRSLLTDPLSFSIWKQRLTHPMVYFFGDASQQRIHRWM